MRRVATLFLALVIAACNSGSPKRPPPTPRPTGTATVTVEVVPYVPISQRDPWPRLRKCETAKRGHPDGDPTHRTKSYVTAYGMVHAAWARYRDPDMPVNGEEATLDEQTIVAERIKNRSGWDSWPACSIRLGLR